MSDLSRDDIDNIENNLSSIVFKTYTKVDKSQAVRCDDCKRTLLDIIINTQTDEIQYIVAKCEKCNSKSFNYKIVGRAFVGVSESAQLVDVETEILDKQTGTIQTVFKVRP